MTTTLTAVVLIVLAAGWAVTARMAVLYWGRLHTDPLTGLPNRAALMRAFRRATRRGFAVGVLLVDLDAFKAVNDAHGHDAGNVVLRTVARELLFAAGAGALPVRLHGDEFAILLPSLAPGAAGQYDADLRAASVAAAIRAATVELPGETVRISATVGAAVAPVATADLSLLLRVADQRMYAAKTRTGNRAVDTSASTPAGTGRWSA